ncbi:MAG: DUF790 family protein [Promethearchaeota archaeon]
MGLSKKKFHSYGERLSIIFHQITRSLLKSGNEFDFEIKVLYRDRKYLASSEGGEFPLHTIYLRPDFIEKEIEKKPVFDSLVEEKFFKIFEKEVPKGWAVIHEPEPVIVPETGTLFIPDFALIRGDIKVYVEIIGFWTESYKKKKKEKLRVLKEYIKDIKLILLIDEKYKDFFDEDFGFPTVFYSSKGIKTMEILNILEQSFSDFEDRLNAITNQRNEIAKKIETILTDKTHLSIEELFEILNCYTPEELHQCLEIPEIARILSENELVCIPHLLCIKKETLTEFKESLILKLENEEKGEMQLNFLENWMQQTYGFPVKLTGLLNHLGGFEVHWRGIHNPIVKYTGE